MNENGLTFLDRLIGWFSPRLGIMRAAYRTELRNYDAARVDPSGGNWFPANATPEMTDAPSRDLIRARMRDLERNGDVTEGVIDAFLRNVVGNGFVLEAQAVSVRGKMLDAVNDRIEELWHDWSKPENCDITGDCSFGELLEMIVRRWEVDGEVFILRVVDPDGDGVLPLKLQLLEPDMLAGDIFQYGNRYVFGGIEVDEHMKAVAYHFRPDPMPYLRDQRVVRYPREYVAHIRSKKRPQQLRGMPDMAVSSERIRNVQEYITNELEAARTASCLTGVVTREKGGAGMGIGNPRGGRGGDAAARVEMIQRGLFNYLRPDEDVKFPAPGRHNSLASGFVAFLLRMIGMSRGLSYETVSRDMSQTNYSSHRGGQLEDRKTYVRKQQKLITDFCDRCYEGFLEAAVLSGKLSLPGFFEDAALRRRMSGHRWSTPGWKWVDPLKEASGIEKQLLLGLTTLSEVCGEQGKDWYEVLKQRKEETDAARELGIELPWFSSQSTTSADEYDALAKEDDVPPVKKKEEGAKGEEEDGDE